jgi:hypothetical protein
VIFGLPFPLHLDVISAGEELENIQVISFLEPILTLGIIGVYQG